MNEVLHVWTSISDIMTRGAVMFITHSVVACFAFTIGCCINAGARSDATPMKRFGE